VEECFKEWDMGATDQLLISLEDQKNQRLERDARLRQAEEGKIQDEIIEAEKDNSANQKQVSTVHGCFMYYALYLHCVADQSL